MELYQLRYFQAVAEFGTLAKAAEELAVSQSAVSRAISLLEKEIGVDLFTRRGRANELNRFGKAFWTHPAPRSAGSIQRWPACANSPAPTAGQWHWAFCIRWAWR